MRHQLELAKVCGLLNLAPFSNHLMPPCTLRLSNCNLIATFARGTGAGDGVHQCPWRHAAAGGPGGPAAGNGSCGQERSPHFLIDINLSLHHLKHPVACPTLTESGTTLPSGVRLASETGIGQLREHGLQALSLGCCLPGAPLESPSNLPFLLQSFNSTSSMFIDALAALGFYGKGRQRRETGHRHRRHAERTSPVACALQASPRPFAPLIAAGAAADSGRMRLVAVTAPVLRPLPLHRSQALPRLSL